MTVDLAKYGIDPEWPAEQIREEMNAIRHRVPDVPAEDHVRYLALQARLNQLAGDAK